MVPMSVAARLLEMCSWAAVISVNGTTLLNVAMNASAGHEARGGIALRVISAAGTSTIVAIMSRPATTVSGEMSWTTARLKRNAEPQTRLNRSSAAVSRGFTYLL